MLNHRKLTFIGVIFLVITFLINYYHQQNHPDVGFNYAYISGAIMLISFAASFLIFTKDNLKN
ncbi:MAG: hypothetical protein HOE93_01290 [Nitrosopumilus sp.]|nr:hypothetical protein [Nitrosopumilus sp.]MBT3861693.1 hypothetical protein [Nitrosopumilus sp.]MBT3955938.1 hypothetical protein [Nitrosopumilus sp.]MBT4298666.1 hypothetical protein [Nitrosopumilus sp.]MBT4535933.1 hypothetical protein [Nitrosopumilus sp.]